MAQNTFRFQLKIILIACHFLLTLGYVLFFLQLDGLPFLDAPNHVARGYVISKLLYTQDEFLNNHFALGHWFSPYIFSDLVLVGFLKIFDTIDAAKIFIATVFFLFPIACYVYLKENFKTPSLSLFGFFVAHYLASNWLFLSGFFAYSLGLSFTLFALIAWGTVVTSLQEKKVGIFLLSFFFFSLFALLCYLTHLSSFLFLGIIVGVEILWHAYHNRSTLLPLLFSTAALIALGVLHLALHPAGPTSEIVFRPFLKKFLAIGSAVIRFDYTIDIVIFCAFLTLLLLLYSSTLQQSERSKESLPSPKKYFLICCALLLTYFFLPVSTNGAYDIDNRVLPLLFFFLLVFGCAIVARKEIENRFSVLLFLFATILSTINFVYLYTHLSAHNERLEKYRASLLVIPEHARVLSVNTIPDEGRINTTLHAGALALPLRNALPSYLFSKDNNPHLSHFIEASPPPVSSITPSLFWYTRSNNVPNWEEINKAYDFLIITKPFDSSRIDLKHLEYIFSNEVSSVFKFRK